MTLEPGTKGTLVVGVEGDTAGLKVDIDLNGDGKPEAQGHHLGPYAGVMNQSGLWHPQRGHGYHGVLQLPRGP